MLPQPITAMLHAIEDGGPLVQGQAVRALVALLRKIEHSEIPLQHPFLQELSPWIPQNLSPWTPNPNDPTGSSGCVCPKCGKRH